MLTLDAAVEQEIKRLSDEMPKNEDIPGCMTLLDTFFQCYSIGSQFKSLYRYGHSSECSYKWQDFKFCLSNKTLSEDEKRDAWIRRRAEWWARRRVGRSSEDVWDIRTEPLKDYPPPTASHVNPASIDTEPPVPSS